MVVIRVALIAFFFVACSDSGWSKWASTSAPVYLHGTFLRSSGETTRLGPEVVTVSSIQIRFRMYIEEDNEWRVTSSAVCGGSSHRDGRRHFVWLEFLGQCDGRRYLSFNDRGDGSTNIEEYVVPVRSAGIDGNSLLNWQGVYSQRR